MAVDVTWTDPSTGGAIDLNTGGTLTETIWDKVLSNQKRFGGTDGNSKTGSFQVSASRTAFLTNSLMTTGFQIDQEGADNAALILADSTDVAHGVTDLAITSAYGRGQKESATAGGLNLAGFSEATNGLNLQGVGTTEDTTHTAAGVGVVNVSSYKKSGTGVGSIAANGNLFCVRDQATTRFIVDVEGNFFSDDTGSTYDEWDDLALVHAFDLRRDFGEWRNANRDTLIRAGILAPDDEHGNRGFVNWTNLLKLHNGALRQQFARVEELAAQLATLAAHPALAA